MNKLLKKKTFFDPMQKKILLELERFEKCIEFLQSSVAIESFCEQCKKLNKDLPFSSNLLYMTEVFQMESQKWEIEKRLLAEQNLKAAQEILENELPNEQTEQEEAKYIRKLIASFSNDNQKRMDATDEELTSSEEELNPSMQHRNKSVYGINLKELRGEESDESRSDEEEEQEQKSISEKEQIIEYLIKSKNVSGFEVYLRGSESTISIAEKLAFSAKVYGQMFEEWKDEPTKQLQGYFNLRRGMDILNEQRYFDIQSNKYRNQVLAIIQKFSFVTSKRIWSPLSSQTIEKEKDS